MAIIAQNQAGWFICHNAFLNDTYKYCIDPYSSSSIKLIFRSVFFDIQTPILMDQEAKKKAEMCENSSLFKKFKAAFIRKRKTKITDDQNYHNEIKSLMEDSVNSLVLDAEKVGYLQQSQISPMEWFENNSVSRQAVKDFMQSDVENEYQELFHEYIGHVPVIKSFFDKQYVLPPHSAFISGDINDVELLTDSVYDVVLIDPPWRNKSIRRAKYGYNTVNSDRLLNLPVVKLTKPGSLVIVWATNNVKQLSFIKDELFLKWNVKYCADWHWIKVTQKGMLVRPLDCHQKKPYENLILGERVCSDEEKILLHPLENHKVIVSVPSLVNSHKPPLIEILKHYIPENAKCLEFFARYLLPGWTSCGNQVLKLQNLELFEKHIE